MKNRLDKNGFTLIELLAVIVILAILMALAVTSMQKVMDNAKRDTYVTTAQQFVNAVRIGVVNGDYDTPESGSSCVIVPVNIIDLEQGNQTSPFKKNLVADQSFIVIRNSLANGSNGLEYYITMNDTANNGFILTKDTELDRSDVNMRGAKSFSGTSRPTSAVKVGDIVDCTGGIKTCSQTDGIISCS